jgi:predicted N-acyltransferase
MHVSITETLEKIPPNDWNNLSGGSNPFVRHEFLSALESAGSVGGKTGWQPNYLVIHEEGPFAGRLIGAAAAYVKTHSYGEYVFDWAWANAYERYGQQYYPKLVISVPFTPVTGPRLLVAAGANGLNVKKDLIKGAVSLMEKYGASSLHWLFITHEDSVLLERTEHMLRTGYQFRWHNPGYRDFDDFLSTFTAQKRKKIKRERRHVKEADISMEVLTGSSIRTLHWDIFYDFYLATVHAHGAIPYLTREFFHKLGDTMRGSVVLVFARRESRYVACALNFRGSETLYGRYWGCRGNFHSLHFETCYYAAIEYAIAQGLKHIEAGAQGEHKLARGLVPTATHSWHWLENAEFREAVDRFLERETGAISHYMDELDAPFRREPPA